MVNTLRSRAILSNTSRPKLRKHVRLQYDPVRQAWAILAPEKIFWPDETSLSIINLCDGTHSLSEIINRLAQTFEANEEEIRPDVEEFLQQWSDRALVNL